MEIIDKDKLLKLSFNTHTHTHTHTHTDKGLLWFTGNLQTSGTSVMLVWTLLNSPQSCSTIHLPSAFPKQLLLNICKTFVLSQIRFPHSTLRRHSGCVKHNSLCVWPALQIYEEPSVVLHQNSFSTVDLKRFSPSIMDARGICLMFFCLLLLAHCSFQQTPSKKRNGKKGRTWF